MAGVGADAYGLSAEEAVNRLVTLLKKEGMDDLLPAIRVIEPVEPAEDGKLYWRATTAPEPKPVGEPS